MKHKICKVNNIGLIENPCQCCSSSDDGIRKPVFITQEHTEYWCEHCYNTYINHDVNTSLLAFNREV